MITANIMLIDTAITKIKCTNRCRVRVQVIYSVQWFCHMCSEIARFHRAAMWRTLGVLRRVRICEAVLGQHAQATICGCIIRGQRPTARLVAHL